jgi:SAM-dependent methyltransferase
MDMDTYVGIRDYSTGDEHKDDKLNHWHDLFFSDCDVAGRAVLDVGCGRGMFLKSAQDRGAIGVLGVDPDPLNVASVKAHGAQCVQAFFDKDANLDGFVPNVVTVFEVIEHVYSPHAIIQYAHDVLKPRGGRIYVSTPNAFNAMRALKFVTVQRHHDPLMDPVRWEDAQHIRGFSFGMVTDLLRMHGFRDVRIVTTRRFLPRYFEKNILATGTV